MRRRLVIAYPHGFCSGVARAVTAAETLLERFSGETIYCLNQIVHNRQVVERLAGLGMMFVSCVEDVPVGSRRLFSAHGVSPDVVRRAAAGGLRLPKRPATSPADPPSPAPWASPTLI